MLVHENATIRQVALEYPESFVKYNRGFKQLRALMLPPRALADAPEVTVLWGVTGSGKSHDARKKYWPDEPYYVWKPSNGPWWDGYDGEKKVIIEEFRGSMLWADLLILLDKYECRVPVKGGFIEMQASKFVITSPKPPREWYHDDDTYDKLSQLTRRCTEVVHYPFPYRG